MFEPNRIRQITSVLKVDPFGLFSPDVQGKCGFSLFLFRLKYKYRLEVKYDCSSKQELYIFEDTIVDYRSG